MKSGVRVPHRPICRAFTGTRFWTLEEHWFFEGFFRLWVAAGGARVHSGGCLWGHEGTVDEGCVASEGVN